MSLQTWQETLITSQVDGTALTASTTPTSIIPAAAKFTLPANFMAIGKTLRVSATGRVTTVTTPGTLTITINFGGTVIASSGAMTLNAGAQTNDTWKLEWLLTCRAIGASANMMHVGEFVTRALVVGVASTALVELLPDTAPAVGSNFDSTATQAVDLIATWSINNADSIQTHQYVLEALN